MRLEPHTDRNRFAQRLFKDLPDRYDRLAELLSFGQNGRWRRAMVERATRSSPQRMLDVASGTAGVAISLAQAGVDFITGVDLTPQMLAQGQRNVANHGLSDRISLCLARAEQLPFPDASFDALTFTYLLRYVDDPAATLHELARVLRPGAVAASLDFMVPPNRFWRLWWIAYTRTVLPLAGLVAGGRPWFEVGRFLGPNISNHYRRYPLRDLIEMWRDAGFVDVGVRFMSLGGGLVMWGRRHGR